MFRLFDNPLHLILLLVVILIVFGAGKLPSVGSALGQSIKEFKKATVEDGSKHPSGAALLCEKCQTPLVAGAQFCASCGAAAHPLVTAAAPEEIFCSTCGTKNSSETRFCAKCGTGLSVRAG